MYLTAKKRTAILRGIWDMRRHEIEATITAHRSRSQSSRKRLLLLALAAACDAKLEDAMHSIGGVFLAEFRQIPPAFYGTNLENAHIYFQGDALPKRLSTEKIALGLVHPQIYR